MEEAFQAEAFEQIWQKVLDQLRAEIPQPTFQLWFSRTRCTHNADGQLRLQVPSVMARDNVESEFKPRLLELLQANLQQEVDLTIIVDPPRSFQQVGAGTESTDSTGTVGVRAVQPASSAEPHSPHADRSSHHSSSNSLDRAFTHSSTGGTKTRKPLEPLGPGFHSEITLNLEYTFDNFVAGPSNRMAHAASLAICESACKDVPSKGYNPFFIHSSVGLGKSHLLQAICHDLLKRRPDVVIRYLPCETFVNEFIAAIQHGEIESFRHRFRYVDVLVIDDIHFLADKENTQEEFFHTFNTLYNARKQIILSSDSHPRDIQDMEDRLLSRFRWGLVTRIDTPTFETRMAILKRKAVAKSLTLPDDVCEFLATHLTTNIRELEGAVNKVHSHAFLMNRTVDLPLVKEALKDTLGQPTHRVTFGRIMDEVTRWFGVKSSDITSKGRTRSIVRPRQIVMFLARRLTSMSLEEVGANLGGRDHSTVLYGVNKVSEDLEKDPGLRSIIESLSKELNQAG